MNLSSRPPTPPEEELRCQEPDCDRKAHVRGLCALHYSRLWRSREFVLKAVGRCRLCRRSDMPRLTPILLPHQPAVQPKLCDDCLLALVPAALAIAGSREEMR